MLRLRLLGSAIALVVIAAGVTPASAATPGVFSLGANFGTGIYSNSDLNDGLETVDIEEVTSGWEYGGSLRYQMSPKVALDLEINMMNPSSTTEDPAGEIETSTPAMAIPLNLYYQLSENDQYAFNLFGGAGILSGAKLKAEQGSVEDEIEAGSSFYGQAGLEAQWKLSQQFALSARALGRTAKATLEDTDPELDVDYSGFAFGLGARVMFGGTGE